LKTNELFGGPLIRLTKQIQASQGHDVVAIPHPRFSTYEDLTKVASELVLIFDDFKLAIKG
ncbi:MAG TPA: hypothetical protein VEB86_09205, partial [Chryseosolibacter sp.]|nr:hypothetical protein [Chryseosolibacter sp.]